MMFTCPSFEKSCGFVEIAYSLIVRTISDWYVMKGQGQNNGGHILILLLLFIIESGLKPLSIVIIGITVMTRFLNFLGHTLSTLH